jgi:hypothetical protein
MGDLTPRSYNDKNIHMDVRPYSDNEMKDQLMMANIKIDSKKCKFNSIEQVQTMAETKKTRDAKKCWKFIYKTL